MLSRKGLMDRERPRAGGGMAAHIPTVAVPYQAPRRDGSLVSSILRQPRLICMTGSRGRPGLLSALRTSRSARQGGIPLHSGYYQVPMLL